MNRWRDLPDAPGARPERSPRRWPGIVVPLALTLLLALAGRRVLAVAVAVATLVLTTATTLRPAWGKRLSRLLAAVGARAADLVSWVLVALVEVVVLIPAAAVARLTRRDPLEIGTGGPTRWEPRLQRPLGATHLRA